MAAQEREETPTEGGLSEIGFDLIIINVCKVWQGGDDDDEEDGDDDENDDDGSGNGIGAVVGYG